VGPRLWLLFGETACRLQRLRSKGKVREGRVGPTQPPTLRQSMLRVEPGAILPLIQDSS